MLTVRPAAPSSGAAEVLVPRHEPRHDTGMGGALETPVSVLLVDDPDDGLAEVLAGHGFAVRTAGDGVAALAHAASDPPDAVVTGLAALGMTGWEFLRRLRAASPRPPLTVTVSEPGREEDRTQSAAAGAHLHLVRPIDTRVLVAVLQRLRRRVTR
jgi:DNA-binding response OmpR family regulator